MVQFRLQICATKLPKIKTKEKIIPWQITSEKVNNAEKHYKKTLDSNLKNHRKEMSRRMKTLRKNDPKEY